MSRPQREPVHPFTRALVQGEQPVRAGLSRQEMMQRVVPSGTGALLAPAATPSAPQMSADTDSFSCSTDWMSDGDGGQLWPHQDTSRWDPLRFVEHDLGIILRSAIGKRPSPNGSSLRDALLGDKPIVDGLRPSRGPLTLDEKRWLFWRRLSEWPHLFVRWAAGVQDMRRGEHQLFLSALQTGLHWPTYAQWEELFADRPPPMARPVVQDLLMVAPLSSTEQYSERVGFCDKPPSFSLLTSVMESGRKLFCGHKDLCQQLLEWADDWRWVAAQNDPFGSCALSDERLQLMQDIEALS